MKKYFYLLLLSGLFAVSCSSDDTDTSGNGPVYLPLSTGNYWTYDVEGSQTAGRDSLYTGNDTLIGSATYKKFKTAGIANGFFSGALSGNSVRQVGTRLELSGSTAFAFSEEFPVAINVSNFIFFDSAAPSGTNLGITTGTFNQATEDGYTLSFDYTLAAVAGAESASYTVPGGGPSYTNVKATQLNLTLKITAMFEFNGISIPVEVLPQQQVISSTQYYAQGIGAVYVATDINYTLSDLSSFGVELPIPSSGSESIKEVLDTYNAE